jgi:hypothetical protein
MGSEVWIEPSTGFGDEYLTAVESISNSPEVRGPSKPFHIMIRLSRSGRYVLSDGRRIRTRDRSTPGVAVSADFFFLGVRGGCGGWWLLQVTVALLLTIFGVAHSGLASLRPWAEEIIGARVRS